MSCDYDGECCLETGGEWWRRRGGVLMCGVLVGVFLTARPVTALIGGVL